LRRIRISRSTAGYKTMDEIKFGTEGWRGVIADDFTFRNVAVVTEAVSNYINKPGTKIVVGYDARFLSGKFAEICAGIFAGRGYSVNLSGNCITSPNLAYITKFEQAEAGIMITASHNPPKFNGLKIKAGYGGPVTGEVAKEIEQLVNINSDIGNHLTVKYNRADFKPEYIDYLKLSIDFKRIIRELKNRNIALDLFHGAAIGYLDGIFPEKNLVKIRNNYDPMFGGMNPEPVVERNLQVLKKTVLKQKSIIGISLDGDGDRVGIIDDTGRYLPPHIVFPLLLYYLVEQKKIKGKVVQATSLGYLSERIAEKYGLELQEVPIGFKNITEIMLKEKIILGGEESGGYAVNSEIPERDGFISGLSLVDLVVSSGEKLSAIVDNLQKEFGKSVFLREDMHLKTIFYDKDIFTEKVVNILPDKINNKKIKQLRKADGLKIIFNDDTWLLLRPSGTEPLIRIYSETASLLLTKKMVQYGKDIINKIKL